jgi:hypothetical protein
MILEARVKAVDEFDRVLRMIVLVKQAVDTLDMVGGTELVRDGLTRQTAELERELRACGERILQLSAAPCAPETVQ